MTRPLLLNWSCRRSDGSTALVSNFLLYLMGELVYFVHEASWWLLGPVGCRVWNRLGWLNRLSIWTLAMMCSSVSARCCASLLIRIFYATL